jgi:hypothetical protein
MFNTNKSILHNKATETIGDTAMLLLMRRLLRDSVMRCALEKIQEPKTARCWKQRLVCRRKQLV